MVDRRGGIVILLNLFSCIVGVINLAALDNVLLHNIYISVVSIVLVLTLVQEKQSWIRPHSYLILSFYVFVWMRYILNLFLNIDIISIGDGINFRNTSLVAVYLGFAMNIICITSVVTEGTFTQHRIALFESEYRITVSGFVEKLIVGIAICFFVIFLIDSVKKISIVNSADYLAVSETLLTQGYRYFSMGKHLLILWILFGKDKNRFFKASTILMIASIGYLMRGARGYAIMYIFMWILFFSFDHRIRLIPLLVLGVALIYLANFILSYRLGWSVATGFGDIVVSTLNSQGSSVEPVFGSVIFREEILPQFSIHELFTRNDFGIIVDRVRGTGFEMGGFGSSYFAETFFLEAPLGLIVLIFTGMCSGILECAYKAVKHIGKHLEYSQIILYMTIPNLIYLGRSSIKDFVFKTMATVIILVVLQDIAYYRADLGDVMKKENI